MNDYQIDIQQMTDLELPISLQDIDRWAKLTLENEVKQGELSISLVSKDEIRELNNTYRKKDKPTNVLAFPCKIPPMIELDLPPLGDVIICPEVLMFESEELHQPIRQHWAHIVIHGVLHILGYDHIEESDAEIMQALEIKLLKQLGFDNPYTGDEDIHDER